MPEKPSTPYEPPQVEEIEGDENVSTAPGGTIN
jgi:hypothetical protein